MSVIGRIRRLEQESSRNKEVIRCVGIVYEDGTVDPESEKSYRQYLGSGIEGPFIWINFLRPRKKGHTKENP